MVNINHLTKEVIMISIIVPCYNEQEALPLFHKEATRILQEIGEEYELLFVNDGSKDETLKELKALSAKDFHVISEKKLRCMQAFVMQKVIILRLWMQIFRIRRRCCLKCLRYLKQANMTAWQREG